MSLMNNTTGKIDYIEQQLEQTTKLKESKFISESFVDKIEMPEQISESLKIGSVLFGNSVEIIKLLGEGAQAKVYLGYINEIDKTVAVKHHELFNPDEEEITKIASECEMIQNMTHENIIEYYDSEYFMNEDHSLCQINIVMEYIEMNLYDYIQVYKEENKEISLPIPLVSQITEKILKGLNFLHKNKIIHRDLKPENILLSKDLTVIKIADFGISTSVKNAYTLVRRTKLGTPYYMSPEAICQKPYAYDTDIWSLGCIVYEMAGGMRPFVSKDPNGIFITHPFQMITYSSPLEIADENILDIFYDKANRILLDFVQKCWRGNNIYRPTAEELLDHPFIKNH